MWQSENGECKMTIPDWAQELTIKVCKDYNRWPPKIIWRNRYGKHSSGVTYVYKKRGFDITVRAGTDIDDQKLVLLHELAHYIVAKSKKGKRESHSLRFWRLAFELYECYGVDRDMAYEREKGYKEKARWAFAERYPTAIEQQTN